MSEFNFSSLATTQPTSNVQRILKPWNIYDVKFVGARKETIKGKKDPNAVYEILKVRFEGDEGYYEESIFFPKPGDEKRPIYKNKDGHEYEGASSFDRTMTFIAQVADVLNHKGFEKMQQMSANFKSFDDVVTAFIKVTDVAKNTKTSLKLVGRTHEGNVTPCLPRFVAVNKNGERFTSDNFIGEKLFFSPYEEGKRAEYLNAKPTDMANQGTKDTLNVDSSEDSGDIDFDKLLE